MVNRNSLFLFLGHVAGAHVFSAFRPAFIQKYRCRIRRRRAELFLVWRVAARIFRLPQEPSMVCLSCCLKKAVFKKCGRSLPRLHAKTRSYDSNAREFLTVRKPYSGFLKSRSRAGRLCLIGKNLCFLSLAV